MVFFNQEKSFTKQSTNFFLKKYYYLTNLVFILTLATIFIGPYVRSEDAGLACPDWPLCHGYVIPPLDYQIYLEFIHRVVAATLGFLFLIWFFIGIVSESTKRFLPYFILSLFVLSVQIFLGRETITRQLNAYVVKFHLLNAIFFVSVIYYILIKLKSLVKPQTQTSINKRNQEAYFLLLLLLLFVFIQIFLGGRVSANYVGSVCNLFPACYQKVVLEKNQEIHNIVYFPPMIYSFEIHMSHRLMAYFILGYALFLLNFFYKKKVFWESYLLTFSLLMFQIFLGILNIVFALPTIIRILHSFNSTILFLSILHILIKLKNVS